MLKEGKAQFIRRTFLAGLLILLPLFLTYILVAFLFNIFTGVGAPIVTGLFRLLGADTATSAVPLVNLLLSLAAIFLLGLVGTNILGRRILTVFEALLLKLPVVKTVYSSTKQVVETFQGPNRSFQRVVLLEYPRKGLWALGFVSTERRDTMRLASADKVLTVFIPTTPNPTSGYLVVVSPDEVVDVDYSIEEAFKFIMSAGIVGKDLAPPSSIQPPPSSLP